jgi:hypothetical protein
VVHQPLVTTLSSFLDIVEATRHYPLARKAWVEFRRAGDPGDERYLSTPLFSEAPAPAVDDLAALLG